MAVVVRGVHVLAFAVLLGGAVLLAVLAARRAEPGVVLAAAVPYEAFAWAALGLMVMTGVGNAGAFGAGLPRPGTPWGDRFAVKLLGVVAVLLLSMARTLVVALAAAGPEPPPGTARVLGRAYGATALLLAGIAAGGVVLAHG